MQRIVVLNPKGGSGKTTLATNLAAWFAVAGMRPALMDRDPQASSMRWLRKRPKQRPPIHGIAAYSLSSGATRSWQLRIPPQCNVIVVDTPAALEAQAFPDITRGADAILVPVMPSDIDIHAAAKCIADLLLVAKIPRAANRIAIVANRVRNNTLMSQSLTRFLTSLDIPLIATLRDTQNYVRAVDQGLGVFEMPVWQVRQDFGHWEQITGWLASRELETSPAAPRPSAAPSVS